MEIVRFSLDSGHFYAPINVNPWGGGSEGKGWGFDQEIKILVNCPRVGKHTFTIRFTKSPPRGKIPNKRRSVLIPLITGDLNLV